MPQSCPLSACPDHKGLSNMLTVLCLILIENLGFLVDFLLKKPYICTKDVKKSHLEYDALTINTIKTHPAMLIRYSVENFLSFNERVEFSLIPGKGSLKNGHRSPAVGGVQVLKSSIILGANASGKSNLIKAIAFGKSLIVRGVPSGQLIDYPKYRLDSGCKDKNSRMEFEIQTDGKNYAYGFVFNNKTIIEEWLYEISRRTQKMIFERDANAINQFNLDPLLRLNNKDEENQFIKFTAKGTPDNQLFLREMMVRKVAENVSNINDVVSVYNWFLNTLKVVFPEDKYKFGLESEVNDDERLNTIYAELLKYFGTGINGICMEDVDLENANIPDFLLASVKEKLMTTKSENVRSVLGINGDTYIISRINADIKIQKLKTKHLLENGSEVLFDTKDESDGTNRIIDLIPLMIDLIEGNNVFIIDEMERSLHPNLIYDIFDLFLSSSTSSQSQLIVATHESSLLTQKLFRKDEIWFVVKGNDNSSHLHSLEDYNVRFDKEIRKDYLLGRFKAIPRIGNRYELSLKIDKDA